MTLILTTLEEESQVIFRLSIYCVGEYLIPVCSRLAFGAATESIIVPTWPCLSKSSMAVASPLISEVCLAEVSAQRRASSRNASVVSFSNSWFSFRESCAAAFSLQARVYCDYHRTHRLRHLDFCRSLFLPFDALARAREGSLQC